MKHISNKLNLAIVASIAASFTSSQAATYVPVTSSGVTFDWTVNDGFGNFTGWRIGAVAQTDLPGAGDTVIVNNNRTAQVTTDVSIETDAIPNEVRANNTNGGTLEGTVEILSGGTLTTLLARSNSGSDRGNFLISGTGTLNATNELRITNNGFVSLDGDAATVTAGAFNAQAGGTLNFDFSTTDNSIVATTGAFNISTGSLLEIDLTSFTPTTGTFELVTFSSIVGSYALADISITPLAGGLTASIDYDADSMNLTIVPEPGTYALLAGLSGLAFVMIRRRRA